MNNKFVRQLISLVAIVFGLVIIIASLGSFLLRVAIACIGFWFINYGLRLRGMSVTRMFTARIFGRGPFGGDAFYR
jgi:hypothetical protein